MERWYTVFSEHFADSEIFYFCLDRSTCWSRQTFSHFPLSFFFLLCFLLGVSVSVVLTALSLHHSSSSWQALRLTSPYSISLFLSLYPTSFFSKRFSCCSDSEKLSIDYLSSSCLSDRTRLYPVGFIWYSCASLALFLFVVSIVKCSWMMCSNKLFRME